MTGNVYEWTSSAFARQPYEPVYPYPYNPNDGREDPDTSGEILRVMRGGCWAYPHEDARCTVRLSVHPANRQAVDGFRLCTSEH
jgi:formylglycine-generating enzyme required for sulfatase activity